jgi:hypothetical protein
VYNVWGQSVSLKSNFLVEENATSSIKLERIQVHIADTVDVRYGTIHCRPFYFDTSFCSLRTYLLKAHNCAYI